MTTIQALFFYLGVLTAGSLAVLLIAWVVKFIERVRHLEWLDEANKYDRKELYDRGWKNTNRLHETDLAISHLKADTAQDLKELEETLGLRIASLEFCVKQLSAPKPSTRRKRESASSKLSN